MSYLKKVSSAMYDPDHDLVFEIVSDADKEIAELKEELAFYKATRKESIKEIEANAIDKYGAYINTTLHDTFLSPFGYAKKLREES